METTVESKASRFMEPSSKTAVPSQAPLPPPPTTDPQVEQSRQEVKEKADARKSKKGKARRSSFGRKFRKGKEGKIHIRLPGTEAYRKEICFPSEAPGRVVVRLERLMGSDKIRPVDGKYMETLIQRLEEEETIAWNRKIRLRKKAETERHRQLAIQGLIPPGPGMEDLYNHPVFRINKIFARLAKLDHSFFDARFLSMPPIEQIDPFEKDGSGAFFMEYPFHKKLKEEWERYKESKGETESLNLKEDEEEEIEDEEEEAEEDSPVGKPSRSNVQSKSTVPSMVSTAKSKTAPSTTKTAKSSKKSSRQPSKKPTKTNLPAEGEDDEDEYDEELEVEIGSEEGDEEEGPSEWDKLREAFEREYNQSLTTLQDKYECPKTDNFEEMWKPYRSELVDKVFTDFESMEEIYDSGKDIMELFTRQDAVTREHIKTAHEPFIYPVSPTQSLDIGHLDLEEEFGEEEGDEEDEDDEEEDEDVEEEEEGDEESGQQEPIGELSPSVPQLTSEAGEAAPYY